jgi:hypothetical protein
MSGNIITTYNTVGNRENLIDKVYLITPTDTPFISAIDQTAADGVFHEWQTDSLSAPVATNAAVEGNDASFSNIPTTSRVGNYTQIITDAFQVSNTQEAVKHAGPQAIARAQARLMMQLKKDTEASALVSGVSSAGSSSTGRSMKGVAGWVATNFFGGVGAVAAVAGTPRAYTELELKQALTSAYNAGGNVKMLLLTSNGKQIQSTFGGNVTRMQDVNSSGEITLKTSYTIYQSDFGDITCVPNRVLSAVGDTAVYGIDTDMWALAVLRSMETEELATTGDGRKFQIRSEVTLEARNEASSFQIRDLSGM